MVLPILGKPILNFKNHAEPIPSFELNQAAQTLEHCASHTASTCFAFMQMSHAEPNWAELMAPKEKKMQNKWYNSKIALKRRDNDIFFSSK